MALYKVALFERVVTNPPESITIWGITTGIGLWRVSTPVLIQQQQDYVTVRRNELPEVTAESVARFSDKGIKPRLFLEEIDKFKLSEFARYELEKIIDALYEAEGQLVLNSNLTGEEFEKQFGPTITRRVKEMCVVKNYFQGQ